MIRLVDRPFDPGAELNAFCEGRTGEGAVVSFVGLARGEAEAAALELQAYPGFTEARMAEIAQDAVLRFGLSDAAIIHRFGSIGAGEAIVMALTAAAHRRAAFEACDFLMDWLKSRAPLWKKEFRPGGPVWVEPTGRDIEDAARWDAPPAELSRRHA